MATPVEPSAATAAALPRQSEDSEPSSGSGNSTAAAREEVVVDLKEKDALEEVRLESDVALAPKEEEKPAPVDPAHWKTNIALLVIAWFLGYTVQFMHVAGSVAIAKEMTDDNNLATLPNALIFAGALLTTMPLSLMGEKFGLRVSYVFGTGMGLTGGAMCMLAMYFWSFPLLCIGLLFQGSQQATTSLVRFGVRTAAPARYMSKALSWVVAGAAIAAPVGPILTRSTVWMIPSIKYMGVYVVIEILILTMTCVTLCLRFPPMPVKPKAAPGEAEVAEVGRWAIVGNFLTNKKFLIAVIAGSVSYGIMVLMMAPAPLAILGAGYTFDDQAYVIMAHVLGMFVPSIFTGYLIDRFGSITMNIVGMIVLTTAVCIMFAGTLMPVFYVGETLVGIGWNFSFIAASSIILKGAKPGRELQTIQGVNDTFIQLLSGVIVLISGPLYRAINWLPLAALSLCIMALAGIAILVIARMPIRGLRDDGVGLKGYEKQKDVEMEATAPTNEAEK